MASLCVYPRRSRLGGAPRRMQCERPLLAGEQKDEGALWFRSLFGTVWSLPTARNEKHPSLDVPELKTSCWNGHGEQPKAHLNHCPASDWGQAQISTDEYGNGASTS